MSVHRTKRQDSTIDTWRSDIKRATLLHNVAKKESEPYVLWERESRAVHLGELQEMTKDRLKIFADDMRSEIEALNCAIRTENIVLAQCADSQPMAARNVKKGIAKLITKRKIYRLLMLQATRAVKAINREENRPKEISKRPKLMANYGDDEHLSFQHASKKFEQLKLRILFQMIRNKLGDEMMEKLQTESARSAINPFTEWAEQNGLREEFKEHIIANGLVAQGSNLNQTP